MDLQSRKIELIKEFLQIQSEELMTKLEEVIKVNSTENHNRNIKPMSVEELNSRIDQSLTDSKNGLLINSKDLQEIVQKWD